MQRQRHTASCAVVLAVAVARVLDVLVAVLGVQRDETETVREKLVREDRGVGFDLNQVDGHRGDFSENRPP